MAGEEDTPQGISEEEVVELWRVECFLDLGFPPHMADRLAAEKVDHHVAKRVLASGPPGGFVWAYEYLMP